jgi:hypothetical protein
MWHNYVGVLDMIDFSKLAAPKIIIVPILQKRFQYQRKNYACDADDGWWVVTIQGNKAQPQEPYFWTSDEGNYRWVSGYSYNNQVVFSNFDVARRLVGINLTAPLHFISVETFTPIKAILWETGHIFYACVNYADMKIYDVKSAYDNEKSLSSLKGVTPELKTLYLFHALERDQLREVLRQQNEAQENEKRMQEIPYRLGVTLERAGARLLGYSQSGARLIVEWELKDGSYKYNSVIDSNTWMVLEAGYCLSGGDKRLNLTSLAKTADEYEERGVIFKTRT